MPSVTYDGRSFMLDGRRIWIVSGSIQHARIPESEWAARVHAARLAGLNTIETSVVWSQVETRPGQFDFTGSGNIRRFVEIVRDAGLYCIVRPGPYLGMGWDLGGLPAWLTRQDDIELRTNSAPFLEAASRYITKLSEQIKDLQVTAPGTPGPILLIQHENGWTCGDDTLATAYLGELARYFRESGLTVPAINANNLWAGVEGQIDCWVGAERMFTTMRQLRHVQPDQPRLAIDFVAPRSPDGTPADPLDRQAEYAATLAAGAQVNVSPFAAGWSFGFGGASMFDPAAAAAQAGEGAPLDASGSATDAFGPLRRIQTFASTFARVFANLSQDGHAAVADPADAASVPSIVYTSGGQGSVVWAFVGPAKGRKVSSVPVVMPDGSTLEMPLGKQHVVWCLMDAHLAGRAVLDYSSLCVLGNSGNSLVCFGPAGASGVVSINGTPIQVDVPKGRKPVVELVEGINVVVVSEDAVDETFLFDGSVFVGVAGVTAEGEPIAPVRGAVRVSPDGETSTVSASKASAPKLSLGAWSAATADDHVSGQSPRYAAIPGPADLGDLGAPYGYGWYRATLKSGATKKVKLGAPLSHDRLHVYLDGEFAGVIGRGPGAASELAVSVKRGDRTFVMLADNAGQAAGGSRLGEPKGLVSHLSEVAPFKPGKPEVVSEEPLDPIELFGVVMGVRRGDMTHPGRVTWSFAHRKKSQLLLTLGPAPIAGVLLVNGTATRFVDAGVTCELLLGEDDLTRGNNAIQFAPMNHWPADDGDAAVQGLAGTLAAALTIVEVASEFTAKAEWAFAKWEPPGPTMFEQVAKSRAGEVTGPTWWNAEFEADPAAIDQPVVLDLSGMTKGQLYLNGQNLCRYFVAAADGTEGPAGPAGSAVTIPHSMLRAGFNEIMLFDEHGGNPAKVKIAVDTGRTPLRP